MKKNPKMLMLLLVAFVLVIGIGTVVAVSIGGKEQGMINEEGKQKNGNKGKKYPESGNLKENQSDFVIKEEPAEVRTELAEAYLQSVNYTVVEVDEEKLTAVVEVKVPDVLAELERVVEETIQKNPTMGYEELLSIAKEELQKVISSGEMETKTEQLEIAVENVEGTYKLIPGEELGNVLYSDLERAYIKNLLSRWEE